MTTNGATRISSCDWHGFSRVRTWFRKRGGDAVALFYPQECIGCAAPTDVGNVLCSRCEERLPSLGETVCVRCGEPLDDGLRDLCIRCGTERRSFDRAFSLGPYEGTWATLFAAYKFDREQAVGRWLARRMADEVRSHTNPAEMTCVTHVPMTRREWRKRGFNPSLRLAKWVAGRLRLPERALLGKTRSTRPQRTLSARERAVNLTDAFRARRPGVGGVILVDDLLTTGATANECARALKAGGYGPVLVVTIAHA